MNPCHATLSVLALLGGLSAARADMQTDPHQGNFPIAEAVAGIKGSGQLLATIETSMGPFHCKLFEQDAPLTVANFVGLARGLRHFRDPQSASWIKRPYYNGLLFHRVIPNFMIQGGDVTGTGAGDIGYTIPDEKNAAHRFDHGGVLAMANRGPNTGSSQFFITEGPTQALNDGGGAGGHYQIFGDCAEVDLVKKITRVPRSPSDRPFGDVKILSVVISRQGAPDAQPIAPVSKSPPTKGSPPKAPSGKPKPAPQAMPTPLPPVT